MGSATNATELARQLRQVRQIRQYAEGDVPDDVIRELLEIARWTGSSRNTQPWHFIAITDKDQLQKISQLRTPINWVAAAPLAIAIVLNGDSEVSEAYDEGRVTERLMIGAKLFGLGAGIAWFGNADQEAEGKRILGVSSEKTVRSVVAIGNAITSKDPRPNPAAAGRRPFEELVSFNKMGDRQG